MQYDKRTAYLNKMCSLFRCMCILLLTPTAEQHVHCAVSFGTNYSCCLVVRAFLYKNERQVVCIHTNISLRYEFQYCQALKL